MLAATQAQVDFAFRHNLKSPDRYRKVKEAVEASGRVKITAGIVLALGLRETWLRNILGGAHLEDGEWVAETDPKLQDAGVFQIAKRYHADALTEMEAVASGTWQPVIEGANAYQPGMVPTFRAALPYVVRELAAALDYAREHDVPTRDRQRFAVAAHNSGLGGALFAYRRGDVDSNTAGGDYSAWVLDAAAKVDAFIATHPNWSTP